MDPGISFFKIERGVNIVVNFSGSKEKRSGVLRWLVSKYNLKQIQDVEILNYGYTVGRFQT